MGYLPAALRNYLARLGWSHGDDEIMSTEQLIAWFDIDDINKSASRFDFKKLDDLNAHYIRQSDDKDLVHRVREMLPYLDFAALRSLPADPKAPPRSDIALAREVGSMLPLVETGAALSALFEAKGWDRFQAAIPSLKERARTLAELVTGALYLVAERPLALDEKAAKLIDAEARGLIRELLPHLDASADWAASDLEGIVRSFAEATGAKLGKVAQPLRAALTGRAVSPPVFDVMAVLGREEALARLKDQAA
jgi:glutamyl-tRNA synthetase